MPNSIYEPTRDGWKVDRNATAADLDARDHFASEVRDLHPTQLDRIEKKLDELLVIAKKFLGE